MTKMKLGVWMLGLLLTLSAFAKPRPPMPPFPEGQLAQWRFNSTNSVENDVFDAQGYTLVENWSGYALQMSGGSPRRWLISTFKENGRPNVSAISGTIRFWFAPYWASKSGGGAGPGAWARLADVGRADGTGFSLSLAVDPDGNRLKVLTGTGGTPTTLLDSPIQWASNQWHQVALVYGTNVQLVVDGNVIGSSTPVPVWPSTSEWPQYLLSFGSGFQGQELAGGELDELTTFAGPVSEDYLAWQYGQIAPTAMLGPIVEGELEGGMMAMSGPPPPGGGGGGSGTNEPPQGLVTEPGLKLTVPVIVGNVLSTSLKEADTNSAYEIFYRLTLTTNKWVRAAGGDLGQTNFSVTVPSTNTAFYQAAEVYDTDFDGLSDAYEQWVSGTSKTVPDTDTDGIPDGMDDANSNGVPDYIDYAGLNRAVIWASRASAFEGALSGELTIRLPTPAPTNNTRIVLHLSRNVDYDGDYYLTKLDGVTRVTNEIFFAAGETQQKLLVHAINDANQAPGPRALQVKLESSANYQLDWEMAQVALIDNDLPVVYIFAPDNQASETNGNPGEFTIVREGVLTNALIVQLSRTGTATSGTDYTNINTSVTIPASNSMVNIPVGGIDDTNYEGNETVVLTVLPNVAYQIHTNGGSATVTIVENDLPIVSLVGTDLIASEYAPTNATVTFRRTGNTAQPLIVPFAVGGTATPGPTNDYQTLPAAVTIAAGATDGTLTINALTNSLIEQVETITITIKGSHSYTIGASNSVTVLIDDGGSPQTNIVHVKSGSVFNYSPAIIEMHRWGRASAAGNVPFTIRTNAGGPSVMTTHYVKSGDVGGPNNAPYVIFNAYQSVARMYFSAPNAVPVAGQVGAVDFSWNNGVWAIWYLPNNRYVQFQVVTTNAVEGSAQGGRVRITRPFTGEALLVHLPTSGTPTPAEQPLPDHNLPSNFALSLAANATTAESDIIANTDGFFEGWETLIFNPLAIDQQIAIDPKSFMMFLLENVADPNTLPESDTDNDGLSDRWELANGFDPFTPGEDSLDRDKDGLTNLEEYQNKLDPSSGDTDSDGVTDFAEANAEVDLTELVEIRLRTQDTGKVNNGANCAVCHTVQLRVGDISHFSVRPNATEKSFFLRKGTNYPIYLSDLMQSLGRPNQDTGTPGTSETYTAAILPPTNGTPRAYIFTDPQNRLGTNKVWTNSFPVNPTVPVGTVTVARIEVLWTNVPGNVPLEINPNKGVGLRVFPDRQHWTDGTARNVVRVRIKTTPPLPTGQRILLKSFDVDDPMYPIDPKDTSVDTNDVGTAKGDDNRGTPLAGQLASTVLTLNASGEAITNFTVTFQPGNNFRVAAVLDTPGAQAHLDGLQVTNANLPFYVAPDSSYPANFIGGISPMLTVWRKLHLEIDSMTAPLATGSETLFATGKVVGIKTNYPVAGRSQLSIRHQLIWADGLRQFEQGKVEITGIGTYRITDSATLSLVFNDWLTRLDIEGVPGGSVVGAGAKFYDDDDRYLTNDVLYPSILNLQSPPLPVNQRSAEIVAAIQPKYAPAYISIFDINQTNWNTVQTVPFKRHAEAERFGGPFNTGNQQLKEKDSPQFWAYTVVFGYQELPGEDGDPNGESLVQGDTVKHTFLQSPYSAVFMEAIRERQEWDNTPASNFTNTSGAITLRQDYNATWWRVTAHEIAHGPGGQSEAQDHAEDDIMKAGAPNFIQFSPATIKRFRSTSHWTWYP